MIRSHSRAVFVAVLVFTTLPLTAATAQAADQSRLYLLADDDGNQYWSVDASDPELGVTSHRWVCPTGTFTTSRRCASSSNWSFYTTFSPASVLYDTVRWTEENPVRFHLELDVETLDDFTIHLALQQGLKITASEAATEVSPGVWEGELSGTGSWDSRRGSHIYVAAATGTGRIDTTYELQLGGRSWVDLPTPVPGASVPDLLAQSPRNGSSLEFRTPMRTFWFNDANYEVHSFTSDLSTPATFEVPLTTAAPIVLAWVEAYEGPFVHHLVREHEADPNRMTDTPILTLTRNGAEIAAGAVQYNQRGRGSNSLAALSVQPGTLGLTVEPYDETVPADQPYTAHVLVIHGQRTLSRMRWTYEPAIMEPFIPARTPAAGTCVNRSEPVPATAAVTTFKLDIDWDTVGMSTAAWTPAYDYPNGMSLSCGERGNGDGIRMTVPGERVWYFSATTPSDRHYVSYRDTVFEMDVTYAYAP